MGPPAFSVSSERQKHMWGERNCLSFETAVGGIEPSIDSPALYRSTTAPHTCYTHRCSFYEYDEAVAYTVCSNEAIMF